jgi:HD-like signal output (HDOD) protein
MAIVGLTDTRTMEAESLSTHDQKVNYLYVHAEETSRDEIELKNGVILELLEEVKQRHPRCLRFVLSGQADKETILKSINPAHQFLSKPCKTDELKRRLGMRLCGERINPESGAAGLVSKLESLPSLPTLYVKLTNEINKSNPSMATVGRLVSEDMAMTAKILQLVNSPFFGLRAQVSNPSNAVQLLGLDIIKALVLSSHVFSKFQTELLSAADVDYFWRRSLAVGSYAKRIAGLEKAKQRVEDDCFAAGLLHDVGKLILASAARAKYGEVLALVRNGGTNLLVAESDVLGCSHAEVGAYLLGVWGLPDSVIEAVAFHHGPSEDGQSQFSPLIATHIASIYFERQNPYWLQDGTVMDVDYLRKTGCLEREQFWSGGVEFSLN